jgi:hypothetical protein
MFFCFVRNVFVQTDRFEAAFIWTYRKDYLHGLMTRKHLSWIQIMDVRWEELASKREHILEEISVVYSIVGADQAPDERVCHMTTTAF